MDPFGIADLVDRCDPAELEAVIAAVEMLAAACDEVAGEAARVAATADDRATDGWVSSARGLFEVGLVLARAEIFAGSAALAAARGTYLAGALPWLELERGGIIDV